MTLHDVSNKFSFLGYDSDDESTEHDRHLVAHTRRRNKGKRYAAVASDDPVDYAYFKAVSDRYHGNSEERRPQQQSPKMSRSDPNLNRECYPGGAVAVGSTPYTDNVKVERDVSRSSQRSYHPQHDTFPPESPSMSQTRSVSSGDIAGERNAHRGSYSDQSRSSEEVGKVNTYIRQLGDGGTQGFHSLSCAVEVVGGVIRGADASQWLETASLLLPACFMCQVSASYCGLSVVSSSVSRRGDFVLFQSVAVQFICWHLLPRCCLCLRCVC